MPADLPQDDRPVSELTVDQLKSIQTSPVIREVKQFFTTRSTDDVLYLSLSDGFALLSYDDAPRGKGSDKVRISPGYGYEEGLVTFISADGDFKVKVPMDRIVIWAK